jgi:hypothetical protein
VSLALVRGWEGITVGLEVLTAVVVKSTIFWEVMPCGLLKVTEEHVTSIFRVKRK